MDFLYADLNEIVDPFAYSVEETDNTVRLSVDNDKRVIQASVVCTPGKMTIENGKDESIVFDGGQDRILQIPEYKITKLQTDNIDIRSQYALMKWDHNTKDYVKVDGDTIQLEEQIDELNIANGQGKYSIIQKGDSNHQAKSIGYGSISFGGFRGDKPLDEPDPIPENDKNTVEIPDIDTITVVEGIQSAAFGAGNRAYGNWNFIAGKDNKTFQRGSFAFGGKNAVGNPSEPNAYCYSIAVGESNTVTGRSCFVGGDRNESKNKAQYGITYGSNNVSEGIASIIVGGSNTMAHVTTSAAFGGEHVVNNSCAFVSGVGNKTGGYGSNALGGYLTTSTDYQTVVGVLNKPNPDAMFIVGNGTNVNNTKNIFEVLKDGRAKVGDNVSLVGGTDGSDRIEIVRDFETYTSKNRKFATYDYSSFFAKDKSIDGKSLAVTTNVWNELQLNAYSNKNATTDLIIQDYTANSDKYYIDGDTVRRDVNIYYPLKDGEVAIIEAGGVLGAYNFVAKETIKSPWFQFADDPINNKMHANEWALQALKKANMPNANIIVNSVTASRSTTDSDIDKTLTTKNYVDGKLKNVPTKDDLRGYVQKNDSQFAMRTVYAIDENGEEINLGYHVGIFSGRLPQRDGRGHIAVPNDPSYETDATNKKYVDEHAGTQWYKYTITARNEIDKRLTLVILSTNNVDTNSYTSISEAAFGITESGAFVYSSCTDSIGDVTYIVTYSERTIADVVLISGTSISTKTLPVLGAEFTLANIDKLKL